MEVKLWNSLGCEIDSVSGSVADVAAKVAEWMEFLCDGDVIKVVEVEGGLAPEPEDAASDCWC